MVNNIIRINDVVYVVHRILSSSTTEEDAIRIHQGIGTQSLLRDKDGKWFCCMHVVETEFKDIELVDESEPLNYSQTELEIGDNGGMG